MQFKDIVGQRDIINRLTEIIDSGRISHAQMIIGAEADGSMQIAWAYTQYLCCEHREHYHDSDLRADSCGQCPQCRKIASLQHADLHFVFPNPTDPTKSRDNASSENFMEPYYDFLQQTQALGTLNDFNLSLDSEVKSSMIRVRDAANIVHNLNMKSYEGGWRMLIIWHPERMNPEAANELLKTLEEPLPLTLILMVAPSTEGLLPTITSRVQKVTLHPSPTHRDAQADSMYAPLMVEWLRMLFKLKMKELSNQIDKIAALDRQQLTQFLGYTLDVMRDCFLRSVAELPCHLNSGDEKFDTMFPAMITTNNVEMIYTALNDAIYAIQRNAYSKIALMELSFRISKALKKR